MADTVTLNPGTGGKTVVVENVGPDVICASKIHNGAFEVDGGAITPTNPFDVTARPVSTGGAVPFFLVSAATTNATSAKVAAAQVYGWCLANVGAGEAFVKLYDKASAPTVGTDTPVAVIPVPPGGGNTCSGPPAGIRFTTGVALAVTGGLPNADATAVALGQVSVTLFLSP